MRPAILALAAALTLAAGVSAAPRAGFTHSGAEIRDIRVLGDEWICVVRDPTDAILAERIRRYGPLPKYQDPGHWKRLREIGVQIDAISAEASAATLSRDSNSASWLVNGLPVRAVSLWAQSVGAFPDPEYSDRSLERPRLAEYLYLRLPSGLPGPTGPRSISLTLTAPDKSLHSFGLGGEGSLCWSLKVDQEGYLPKGPKTAFFGMWLGKAGAMPSAQLAGRCFHIIPAATSAGTMDPKPGSAPTAVFTGTIRPRSRDAATTHKGAPISGEELCELDFTALETPGTYKVYIPGIGSSFPFSIGADVFGNAFFATARALYHQRCGVALTPEYTAWTRAACHTQTFAAAYPPDNGEIYNNAAGIEEGNRTYGFRLADGKPVAVDAFTVIRSTATGRPVPGVSGGHHDAADYDRRARHFALTWYLCGIQELYPEHFADGQLRIPESGNGIPDILDEAAVDVDLWMKARGPSGEVPGWIEETRHPTRTETAAEDSSPMYLSLPDRASSFAFAAAAALLSRRIAPYAPAKAKSYIEAAVKAYTWAADPENRIKGLSFRIKDEEGRSGLAGKLVLYDEAPELSARGRLDSLLAALQLAAATGDRRYIADFRSPGGAARKSGIDALLAALPDAIPPFALVTPLFGGILEKAERDKLAAAVLREADLLRSGSESLPYRTLWRPAEHGYFSFMAWGSVHGALRAGMEILAFRLTGSDLYRQAMLRGADWELGANELGSSMITGLGTVFPVVLQHIESDRDGIPEPVPGIAPFALTYGITQSARKWQFGPLALAGEPEDVYPIMRRKFIHPFLEPSQNEFTVMESVAPQAALFGALIPAGWTPPRGLETRSPRPAASLVSYPQP